MPYGTVNADLMTTSDGVSAAGLYGFKNRIINGAMVIDQRNAGASVTPTNGQYLVDRWLAALTQASKYTVQQNAGSVTPPVGYTNYLGITSSSAYSVLTSDVFYIRQVIEGFNIADLAWGTANAQSVTLSFWVRSSLTGTFGGSLQNSAENRSYPFTYTINAANTWEQKTVTIAGDTSGTWVTNNGAGIKVNLSFGAGATYSGTAGAWAGSTLVSATGATSVVGTNGATFYITSVQLEKGSTATSFDYRPYGTELSLCQRYFEKSYNIDVAPGTNTNIGLMYHLGATDAANNSGPYLQFKVTKRVAPTIVPYLATGTVNFWTITNVSGTASVAPNTTTFVGANGGLAFCGSFSAAWTAGTVNGHWTASAEL